MRLGRAQQAVDPEARIPAFESSGEVTEIRTVGQMRVCAACLVVNSPTDAFCTGCGEQLAAPGALGVSEGPTEILVSSSPVEASTVIHPPVPKSALEPLIAREPKLRVAFAGTFVVALVAVGGLAFLWQSERTHRHRTVSQRSVAQANLAATNKKLARTVAALSSTRAISDRRKAVLLRAQAVLAKVDPLLSDADGIKQVTGQIQSARDTFAADSAQMTSDLLYLENYEANPQDYPGVDQYGLVSQVDSELYTVRSDYSALTAYDGQFSTASTKFGNHATAFTAAVRELDSELRRVAK
jgi:hypothetical protein